MSTPIYIVISAQTWVTPAIVLETWRTPGQPPDGEAPQP